MTPTFTRRRFAGLALAAMTPVASARALPSAPNSPQNAGWSRFGLGAFEITVLSDGNLTVPAGAIGANVARGEVAAFLEERFLDPITNYAHTNHVLVDTGSAKVLVDVGSGEKFQTSAGRLLANLEAAGIEPSEITHVALTHAHPDHVWGMMDEFGDEPRFPEAEYTIAAREFDWWTAENRISSVPDEMQPMVVGAQNALGPVAERTRMLAGESEIAPGVRMIDTPGHTFGHMSLLVESQGEAMLVTGDAVTHAYASFERPDWRYAFDMDGDAAAATRKRLLDMAAADRITIAGYHLPFPGVGHVLRRGDGYQFIPAPWLWSE